MQFLVIAAAMAVVLWIVGNFMPAAVTFPSDGLSAITGLGKLVADVNYFVPVTDILGAMGFVVVVYNFRLAIVLVKWLFGVMKSIGA